MNHRKFLLPLLLGLLLPTVAPAQPTPAELAEGADLVAVVVVEQVDYRKTRDFPSSGSGFLRVLIPYRGTENGEWLEVRERGLGDEKCYYPEPDPFKFEGARFLVMLRKAAEGDYYNGVAPGCRIPVLVTADNGYAVRYPVDGLAVPADVAEPMTFNDPAAIVDAGDFTSMQVEELVEVYFAEPVESGPLEPDLQRYRYTRGIPLGTFRRLLELDDRD